MHSNVSNCSISKVLTCLNSIARPALHTFVLLMLCLMCSFTVLQYKILYCCFVGNLQISGCLSLKMAGRNTHQDRRVVNCMICYQHLCKPKLLPCMHSCCEDCLREFVVSRLYDTLGRFPCPCCGQATHLPPEGVSAFPNGSNVAGSAVLKKEPFPLVGSDLILSFGCYGTGTTDLTQPVGLAVKGNQEIVVTDRSTNRILTYSLRGEVKSIFACRHTIADIAVTPRDTVVVASADIREPLAIEYDNQTGARLRSFGRFNCLEATNGIAVVSSPFAVVVSSFETGSVHILSESGRLVRKFSRRAVVGQAYHLCGNSRGDIVVSDYANSRVVVVDTMTGSWKAKMGGIGTAAGSLYQPLGVCVDINDDIIVADSGNQRVVLYSVRGTYRGIILDMSMGIGKPCNVACVPGAAMLVVLVTGHHYAQIRVYSYNPNRLYDSTRCQDGKLLSLCVC